jgi:hypothetical protein
MSTPEPQPAPVAQGLVTVILDKVNPPAKVRKWLYIAAASAAAVLTIVASVLPETSGWAEPVVGILGILTGSLAVKNLTPEAAA